MRAPSIAAVNGPAAGAGFSLALACDFLIASDTAQFASAYAAAGLSADGGQSWTLPRRIGSQRARLMMLQGRRVPAAEALDWGIADQVVAPDQLTVAATQMAENLASGPTAAFGRMKNLWSIQIAPA
jgi:2-(1,2-epoxy-1,2-dihydrophenyl)acetyl-CoA isomerase